MADRIPESGKIGEGIYLLNLGFVYNKPFGRDYTALDDDQVLDLEGVFIRCIATLGHTAGHMSYLVNGTLFIAGDILNLSRGIAVMDRRPINIDNERRRESIRRLARLGGVTLLCPMHSGYTQSFDAAMRDWK